MAQRDRTESIKPSKNRAPMSTSIVPQKRKGASQVKFYAVKAGHNPGVYLSWKECEQNISGFKGAAFKSFPTHEDAEAYVAGHVSPLNSGQPSSQVDRFYGIAKGRNPGVYTDWDTAQEQINGWKFPKYKKFATRAEAEEFVRSNGNVVTGLPVIENSEYLGQSSSIIKRSFVEDIVMPPAAKRARITSHSSFSAQLGSRTKTDLGRDILDPEGLLGDTGKKQAEIIRVYTDGSSLSNGQRGARAGLGVYFGPGDPRNIAERLPGALQTNQRGELAAILRALEISPADCEVHIVTDSKYSINCVTEWYKKWERNGWQTANKQPVLNMDLIQKVLARIRDRNALGAVTLFFWIKGHANDPGNEAADRLAVLGAQKSSVD